MLTIVLNMFKKELIICTTIEQLVNIRKKLDDHKIDYDIKTVDEMSTGFSFLASSPYGDRRSRGISGVHSKYTKQFYIYVQRKDYEKANFLIQKSQE